MECITQLRRWADVFVIAPLDANTMAKMANGLCDNLLVSYHGNGFTKIDTLEFKSMNCGHRTLLSYK